ncbi:DUF4394 domain-containing protein [Marinivivus vitaminiproducens]|uniref:DUF4394 domain-containing protein n=1 Tax=Marinivivus vitaminiproducens TaxID=3035935 RepID=UPI0027A43B53|nr:DUF4394 domain-containing protein [Geminicoccaceae bacterium SCSIO 64248]
MDDDLNTETANAAPVSTSPLGNLPPTQEGIALAPDLINGVDPARLTLSAKDANVGVDPMVTANAYTNSVAGATSTQQYVLDHGTNTLATLANNDGTLATVGEVMVGGAALDFDANAGFDIMTDDAGMNTAYALLTSGGDTGLYTLDLETGAATSMGALGGDAGMVNGLAVSGTTAYALGNDGSTLLSFDVSDPGAVTSTDLGGNLDAIDFRPATGDLYGYDDATDAYFTVDAMSGELTAASVPGAMTDTGMLDMDWNPTIDRLRVVTETDQNIVYNPEAGNASDAATMPLFYDAGDATVSFESEIADLDNDLGVYLIGADGTIGDGAIAFRSIMQGDGTEGTLAPGASVDLTDLFETGQLADAEGFGFTLFQNGSRDGGDGFTVRESDGGMASLDSDPADLVIRGDDGELIATKGDVFNSFDRLNVNGETRVISGVDDETGNLRMGFEDLDDQDFNDLTIAIDNGTDQRMFDDGMSADMMMADDAMAQDDAMLV